MPSTSGIAFMSPATVRQWLGAVLVTLVVVRLIVLLARRIRVAFPPAQVADQNALLSARRRYLVSGLVLTLVVVYGSLVPLNYQPLEWEQALQQFADTPYLELGVGHRADWVANILLFLPLGFCWMAAFSAHEREFVWQVPWLVIVGISGTTLAIGLEFAQLWFPPRTVSQNDIVAEVIGTILGASLWLIGGPQFTGWLQRCLSPRAMPAMLDGYLKLYLLAVLLYAVMPLDFVVTSSELSGKYERGRIAFATVEYTQSQRSFAIHAAIDLIKFAPVGLLIGRTRRRRGAGRSLWGGVLMGLAIVAAIEVAQVFVYSRSAEAIEVLTGGAGILLGTALGAAEGSWGRLSWRWGSLPVGYRWSLWLILFGGYAVTLWLLLAGLSGWSWSVVSLQERMEEYLCVPFARLYWGSEFHALSEILKKCGAFVPLGVLGGLLVRDLPFGRFSRFVMLMLVTSCCLLLAVLIELQQAGRSDRFGDVTDSLLYLTGFGIGMMIVRQFSLGGLLPNTGGGRASGQTLVSR